MVKATTEPSTQAKVVLEHLIHNGRLSQGDASFLYGINRLAARIDELRKAGYVIESHAVKIVGAPRKRFVSYRLEVQAPAPVNPTPLHDVTCYDQSAPQSPTAFAHGVLNKVMRDTFFEDSCALDHE